MVNMYSSPTCTPGQPPPICCLSLKSLFILFFEARGMDEGGMMPQVVVLKGVLMVEMYSSPACTPGRPPAHAFL